MTLRRRELLAWAAALVAPPAGALAAGGERLRLGAAWRGVAETDPQQLGVLEVDWAARRVSVRWQHTLPGRAHGLLAEPDGGLVAMAMRPGVWMMRCDAEGRVAARIDLRDERADRRFDGHVVPSADGRWLYTTETDLARSEGWVGVRDRTTLRKVAEFRSHGPDPHQLLVADDGTLLLANGGLHRGPDGRKRDLERMDASLVRLDPQRGGERRGQWRLDDPRLSLRHLAWSEPGEDGRRLLGIALQAEHDDPVRRAHAPILAVWDGERLTVPSASAEGGGYAGDIAAAAGGGFVLSAQKANRALRWSPAEPGQLTKVAELTDPCALAAWTDGQGAVVMAGALGVGRWHPSRPGAMLAWPQGMALDNHWVVMAAA